MKSFLLGVSLLALAGCGVAQVDTQYDQKGREISFAKSGGNNGEGPQLTLAGQFDQYGVYHLMAAAKGPGLTEVIAPRVVDGASFALGNFLSAFYTKPDYYNSNYAAGDVTVPIAQNIKQAGGGAQTKIGDLSATTGPVAATGGSNGPVLATGGSTGPVAANGTGGAVGPITTTSDALAKGGKATGGKATGGTVGDVAGGNVGDVTASNLTRVKATGGNVGDINLKNQQGQEQIQALLQDNRGLGNGHDTHGGGGGGGDDCKGNGQGNGNGHGQGEDCNNGHGHKGKGKGKH